MRAVLQAIADELQRLKSEGESTVAVSEATLGALRAMVKTQRGSGGPVLAAPAAERGAAKSEMTIPVNPLRAERAAALPKAPAAAPSAAVVQRGVVAGARGRDLPPPPRVVLPDGDKAARWSAWQALVATDAGCLAQLRPGVKPFFGMGSLDAKIVFVADAPSEDEERAGSPWAGASGELLAKMVGAMGLKPEAVFVTTLLPWRPQTVAVEGGASLGDRPPAPTELAYGAVFFRALLELLQPVVVVALGQEAAQGLRGGKIANLAEVRGQWTEFAGIPLLVTCKPSYLIRSGSTRTKRMAWEELLLVMERAGLPISDKQRGFFR